MKKLALIGSKDFAEQIQCFVERTGEFVVVGYFDDFEPKGKIIRSLPVLGRIDEIEDVFKTGVFDNIFLAAGYNNFKFRENVFNDLYGKVPFANIIMPEVTIEENVTLGEGIFIGENSVIGQNTIIEDNVFMHMGTFLSHDNKVGMHTYISGRVDTAGFVTIGKRNFIGVRALFSDHITICDDVWIGIGCMVLKDIKEPGKYMTNNKLYKIE
jgi:sugar O-acyltransferase (sialic acid O-acetyltransferase NeuD family)